MISLKLEKPQKTLVERVTNYYQNRRGIYQIPNIGHTWNKQRYSHWIEQVKLRFKKGDIVTLKKFVSYQNALPFLYRIAEIQEIHYMAEIDTSLNVPKCIGLNIVIEGSYTESDVIWRSPDDLRSLTYAEEQIYDKSKVTKVIFDELVDDSERLRLAYTGQ